MEREYHQKISTQKDDKTIHLVCFDGHFLTSYNNFLTACISNVNKNKIHWNIMFRLLGIFRDFLSNYFLIVGYFLYDVWIVDPFLKGWLN